MPNYPDETQTPYPKLPSRADSRWQQVILHARHSGQVAMSNLPRAVLRIELTLLNDNDIVYIMPSVCYGDWIAVKHGHRVGWVDMRLTQFTPLTPLPLTYFDDEAHGDSDTAQITERIHRDTTTLEAETDTSRRIPPASPDESPPTPSDIRRVIAYLRRVARTLKNP